MVWLAVFLAVLGAFCLALGAQRQGSAVKADTGGLALSSHGLLRLLRNPRWVLGLLLLGAGMAMNAIALVSAPLTVVQPNLPPVANPDTFQAIGNVTVPVAAPGVLANDTDPDGDALGVVADTVTTANGGTAILNAGGSFTYLSAAGFTGTDSFEYRVTDGIETATGTVTIQVATRVWYVSNAGTAPGDGRDASPFVALKSAEAASAAGETIFLLAGDGSTTGYGKGIVLKNGQSLTGQGIAADVVVTLNGQQVVLMDAGSAPTVTRTDAGTTVQLASGNTVQGLHVASSNGAGIAGSGFGTFAASAVSVGVLGGAALELQNGAVAASLGSVSSSNSAGAGLSLVGVSGSFSATGGAINGATGAGVAISGGNATIDYAGSISGSGAGAAVISGRTGGAVVLSGAISDTGNGIVVQNNTGGTISFTGSSKSLSTGAANGVTLANNSGAAVVFGGGGLAIATTTGTGFSATGGGTVTVTGANNTVAAVGGRAVNVANTTIGASGLTFRSISADGGANGIVLANTGGANGLQVTGDGSLTQNGSGGTISGTSSHAVSATAVNGLVLRSMTLDAPAGDAIRVSGSAGVELAAVRIFRPSANGVSATELSGSNRIEKSLVDYDNTSVAGSFAVRLENTAASGSLLLDGTTVRNKLDGTAAVVVSARGAANVAFTVRDSDTGDGFESLYTNLFGSAIVVGSGDSPGSTAHVTARVSGTRFVNAAPNGINNLEMGAHQNAVLDFVVRGNVFDAVGRPLATVGVLNINATGQGRIGSTAAADSIAGNTFQNLGTAAAQGYLGIRVAVDNLAAGTGHKLVIADNTFLNLWRQAILVSSRTNANDVNVRIVNNTIGTTAAPVAQGNRRGVELEAQGSSALKVEVVDNPSIVNNSTSSANPAVSVRSIGSASLVSATVLNNTIGNANGVVAAGRFRAETQVGTTAGMCLDLRDNSLEDATRLYEVFASGAGLFQVEGPGAAVVTPADLTARNTVGTGSVAGTPVFSNGANCVQPSL
jgi:hypothetical protein